MQGKMHSFRSLTRLFVLCLCVATALTLLAGLTYAEDGDSSGTAWKDGTYEGTGTGRNGDVTVSVTISGGKIVKIEEVSQKETESYWEKAKVLLTTIVEQQSADVDSISGATKSSDAIKSAVKNALGQAAEGNDLYAGGSGTEKDPYVIKNAEQLQNFAKSVDEGENYAGQYVALGEDIDLSDIEN